ncbi:MAG: adenylate/guanylate cyclase domain-containing protein [Bacteroidota bacterium]
MNIRPATRYKLGVALEFGIIFQVQTLLFYLIYVLTGPVDDGKVEISVDLRLFMAASLGLIIGLVEEFLLRNRLKRLPFISALLLKTGIYTLLMVITIPVLAIVGKIALDLLITDIGLAGVVSCAPTILGTPLLMGQMFMFFAMITFLTLSVNQIQKFVGPGRLVSYVTGKYNHATWEDYILMFVDLKASTSLSEELDTLTYSDFISDFIDDITEAIYTFHGRIYQYVGDEVIVYWRLDKRKKKNARPLHCFVRMMDMIEERAPYYREKYGMLPQFKAGLHGGRIVVKEVGELKKEIAFHGNPINTTSRIQTLCNDRNTNFLMSEYILERVELLPHYTAFSEGKFNLKGKKELIELFRVERISQTKKQAQPS